MKRIFMALLLTGNLFSACSKDPREPLSNTQLIGQWTLSTVITQLSDAAGVISRDTTTYGTGYMFVFDDHGTYFIFYTEGGVAKEGAGNWYEGTDGKVTLLNGHDSEQEMYVASTLTATDLVLYNTKVKDDKTTEVWLNLKK